MPRPTPQPAGECESCDAHVEERFECPECEARYCESCMCGGVCMGCREKRRRDGMSCALAEEGCYRPTPWRFR